MENELKIKIYSNSIYFRVKQELEFSQQMSKQMFCGEDMNVKWFRIWNSEGTRWLEAPWYL